MAFEKLKGLFSKKEKTDLKTNTEALPKEENISENTINEEKKEDNDLNENQNLDKTEDDNIFANDESELPNSGNENIFQESDSLDEEFDDSIFDDDEDGTVTDQVLKKELDLAETEGVTENIDEAINKLLKEDANTELMDVDYNYINDVSVYDTMRKNKDDIREDIKNEILNSSQEEQQQNDKSLFVMYIIIGILILLTIISFIVLLVSVKKAKSSNINSVKKTVLEQPEYRKNNANYIYLTKKASFDNQELKLSKILIDSTATLFYFDNKIDVQKYDIILSDNRKVMYNMDLSFVQSTNLAENNNQTILRFDPINHSSNKFKLEFYNPITGEKVEFPIEFSENIKGTPVKYASNIKIKDEKNNADITIDNATFSSAGSKIEYVIKTTGKNYNLSNGNSTDKDFIILTEGSNQVLPTKSYPTIYSFNDGEFMLGRMDFEAIKNLNSGVEIRFKNLFKKYDVNKTIPAANLSSNTEDKNYEIEVDNYKVIFEGLALFNDKYILVFHAEDKNIKRDKTGTNDRIEVQVDAQLIGSTESGMEIALDGTCKSAKIGTDMVFPITETAKGFIYGINRDNINIKINSIMIKTDDIVVPIDLSKVKDEENIKRTNISDSIVKNFKERLSYKSGKKTIESIFGFDKTILNNPAIMENYIPQDLDEEPLYSAQVVSSCLDENGKYYAVVQELWKGVNGMKETLFYRTHKIMAEEINHNWIIKSDVIIR